MGAAAAPNRDPDRPTLLYDGHCRACTAFARFVIWADVGNGIRVLPFQDEEAATLLAGWSRERVEAAAHLVLPDGRVVSGAEAFGGVLDRLPLVGRVHRALRAGSLARPLDELLYALGVCLRERTACAGPTARSAPSGR